MEQRDYLLRQIELMTQTLVALIRRLLGLKDLSEKETQRVTDEVLKEQLDISMTQIIETEPESIVELLTRHNGITISNVDLFADILVINAKARHNANQKLNLLVRALKLYEWIDMTGNTFSIERHQKINDIRMMIEDTAN